jgi:hypothetical protein
MSRIAELCAAVSRFLEIHEEWREDRAKPPIDDRWTDGMGALFQVFMDGDVPAEARELEDAVQRFSDCFQADEEADFLGKPERMYRTWGAIEAIERRMKELLPKEKRPIESMQLLNSQGVHHEQIARMHGLVDEHGHGKYWLVADELAKPGKIMGPDGFAKPEYLPKADSHARRKTLKRPERKLMSRRGAEKSEPEKPCPETPKELWQQRLGESENGINQAARMLQKPVEEVRELFREFDDEAAGNASDEKVAKIQELAAAGMDAKTIAKKVESDVRTVKAVMERGKQPA